MKKSIRGFGNSTSKPSDKVRPASVPVAILFDRYEQAGFLYQQKKRRLLPWMERVQENYRKVERAGETLLYHIVDENKSEGRWASVSIWRTTTNGWNARHLAAVGGPIGSRNVLLESQKHRLQFPQDVSSQNWFSPGNRFAMQVFGSIEDRLGAEQASVSQFDYYFVPLNSPSTSYRRSSVRAKKCTGSDQTELIQYLLSVRGSIYVACEELDKSDLNLDELNALYQSVGLHRIRRCFLAFLPGRDTPIAAALAYRGPLGFNFSFLENRCDLIVSPELNATQRRQAISALIDAVLPVYADFPLQQIPVIVGKGTAMPESSEFIRTYLRSIWLSGAYEAWHQDVDEIYRPIVRFLERGTAASHDKKEDQ